MNVCRYDCPACIYARKSSIYYECTKNSNIPCKHSYDIESNRQGGAGDFRYPYQFYMTYFDRYKSE